MKTVIGKLGELYISREQYLDERGIVESFPTFDLKKYLPDTFEPKEVFYSKSNLGAIRGMHLPVAKSPVDRIIGIMNGLAHDIIVDNRKSSKTEGDIVINQMDESSPFIYIPAGVAHGFQALSTNTIMIYFFGCYYRECSEFGFNPLSKNLKWPLRQKIISEKDSRLPQYEYRSK